MPLSGQWFLLAETAKLQLWQFARFHNEPIINKKIDETKFEITDGENTYKLIWEGDIETGEPVITNFKNNQLVSEDIQKMKFLWGFKPEKEKKIIKEEADETFKKMFRKVKGK